MGGGNQNPEENTLLPVPNSTASYWRSEPHWLDEHRSTPHLPEYADIVIVGTGITGVSTAYHLLDGNDSKVSSPSIMFLEARQTCSGATARNGGHAKKVVSTIPELIDSIGKTAAEEFINFTKENIYALKSCIEKEGIQCEAEFRRSFDVMIVEEEANKAKEELREQMKSGFTTSEQIWLVDGKNVERITSIHDAKVGISTLVLSYWPYKFVTQLLEIVMKKGANLQTNTPVTTIHTNDAGHYTLLSPRGCVKTPIIVFATNGYTAGLLPQYRGVITPTKAIASHIVVPEGSYAPYLSNTYNLFYGGSAVDYLNPRPDGSIVVGGGKETYYKNKELWYDVVDDSTLIEPARHYFDGLMQRHFHGWEKSNAVTEKVWTGIQGVTPDAVPHVGKIPGSAGQYICAGYNGGGNAQAFLCARAVAQMIRYGVSFEETGLPGSLKTTHERVDAGQSKQQ